MKLLGNVLLGVGAVGASSIIMENIVYSKSVASPKKKDENPEVKATEDTAEAADTVESFDDSVVEVTAAEKADEAVESEATTEEKVEEPANAAESQIQQDQQIQTATFNLDKLADLLVKTNYPAENVGNYVNWLIANAAVPAGAPTVAPEPIEKVVVEPVQPAQGEVIEEVVESVEKTATKKPSTKKMATKKTAASTKVTETK